MASATPAPDSAPEGASDDASPDAADHTLERLLQAARARSTAPPPADDDVPFRGPSVPSPPTPRIIDPEAGAEATEEEQGEDQEAGAEADRTEIDADSIVRAESPTERPPRDPLAVLEDGAEAENVLVSVSEALAARQPEQLRDDVAQLTWLHAHSKLPALQALDSLEGEQARIAFGRLAEIIESPSDADLGIPEALVAASALGISQASEARERVAQIVEATPALEQVLHAAAEAIAPPERALRGEIGTTPRGTVWTTVAALTLVLFVMRAVRLVGRSVLGYRRPAEVLLTPRGLELQYRTELMGRVLHDRVTLIPLSNINRVSREVRFSRAGLYAGLLALVLGSYFGMGLLVDGLRVPGGSFPLLAMAVLLITLGLVLDFGLTTLSDSARGKCRLLIVPRRGKPISIAGLDPMRADAMLAEIADGLRER